MRNAARRHPLWVFFGLAFLLTWALIPLVSVSVGFGLLALFGPAAAAVITAKLLGPEATADLRQRTTRWRVRLVDRHGPWLASAIVGGVWGLWHFPLFYVPGMPQYGTSFPAFVVYTVALSVLLTVFAQRTAGSLVIATLFHGAVNTFGLVNEAAGPILRGYGNAIGYGIAAAIIGGTMIGRRQAAVR